MHLPAFPGEGVGTSIVVGQRVSYTVIGNGLAVIGGQTILPAIGGVAVSGYALTIPTTTTALKD